MYEPVSERIRLISKPSTVICDLASGNGIAAIMATAKARSAGANLLLTDKFPNPLPSYSLGSQSVVYLNRSFDLRSDSLLDAEIYTLFNGLHHFSLEEIEQLIGKIKARNGALLFAEPLQTNFLTLLKVLVATTMGALFFMPFVRPFRWYHLLFTYVLPIGIFAALWDGVASVTKAYSKKELLDLTSRLEKKGIHVRFEIYRGRFATLYTLHS